MNVTISPNTHIGEGAIVALGTRVFGNVPKFAVIGSGEWKVIKMRNVAHYNDLKKNRRFARENGMPLNLNSIDG